MQQLLGIPCVAQHVAHFIPDSLAIPVLSQTCACAWESLKEEAIDVHVCYDDLEYYETEMYIRKG